MSGPSPDIALNAEMARLHHAGGLTLAQIGAKMTESAIRAATDMLSEALLRAIRNGAAEVRR